MYKEYAHNKIFHEDIGKLIQYERRMHWRMNTKADLHNPTFQAELR